MYLVHETEIWILLSARVQIPDLQGNEFQILPTFIVKGTEIQILTSERDQFSDPNLCEGPNFGSYLLRCILGDCVVGGDGIHAFFRI